HECTSQRINSTIHNHTLNNQFSLPCQNSGWQNHDFTRDRKDRAFQCHQDNDAQIAAMQDPTEPDLEQMMHWAIFDLRFQIEVAMANRVSFYRLSAIRNLKFR